MEKYSAYRDQGTGIQPFLTPVPPPNPKADLAAKLATPLTYLIATIRLVLVLVLFLLYTLLVSCLCTLLAPLPPLHRALTRVFTSIITRSALLTFGFFWIPVELVTRKRGRINRSTERWNPKAGDVIVSNFVSWVELLWLAFRFNPIFVFPVPESATLPTLPVQSSPVTHTPGRRTGTGSANVSSPSRVATIRIPITGFKTVSLLSALRLTGLVPPFDLGSNSGTQSLESIRKEATRPIVVFPECTTSNGRGLLRFADVFNESVPVKGWNVFVMCVRYDPPMTFAPTLSHSIPSTFWNPLPQVFSVATSLAPQTVSIRLLLPSESPSSPLFMVSEVITTSVGRDQLSEVCAALIAQIGKMKRMGLGWEDKVNFLDFYRGKRRR